MADAPVNRQSPAFAQAAAFLDEVEAWERSLQPFSLRREIAEPSRAAVFCADMVVGFCRQGSLASPRVDALTGPVVELFRRAHGFGIRDFLLAQDAHHHSSPEFQAFPPHCVRGSEEAQGIPELRALPFAHLFTTVHKNSLHPAIGSGLDRWLDSRSAMGDAIVVGDCTDLCVYQLAMHLRLRANAMNREGFRVIVPANLVDTYDMPIARAHEADALAHPGDFFHRVFLYHLALNGVQVVREVVE